jgi:pSer/pThr/pTyr-binding forkhead associated (FHA) protein
MNVRLQRIGVTDEELEIRIDRFPFVIGRRSENDCPLPLACVSRRHCQFTCAEEQVLVQDLESHNGTFVNGRRALRPLPVRHGDELCLGPIAFRVLMPPERDETVPLLSLTHCEHAALTWENAPESPRPSRS